MVMERETKLEKVYYLMLISMDSLFYWDKGFFRMWCMSLNNDDLWSLISGCHCLSMIVYDCLWVLSMGSVSQCDVMWSISSYSNSRNKLDKLVYICMIQSDLFLIINNKQIITYELLVDFIWCTTTTTRKIDANIGKKMMDIYYLFKWKQLTTDEY